MIRGLHTAVSGMITLEAKQSVITNNLANINNNGYKANNLISKSFKDVMIQNKDNGSGENKHIGTMNLGARIDETYINFEQGVLKNTNKENDFAIEGEGFFVVRRGSNNYYTRDGHFRVNTAGYLVTTEGDEVLGQNKSTGALEPIFVGNNSLRMDSEKNLFIGDNSTHKLAIASFKREDLEKLSDNLYRGTNPDLNKKTYVKQGYIEQSNVNLVNEMTEMLTTMRSFESNQRIIKTMDETLGKAANDIGSVN